MVKHLEQVRRLRIGLLRLMSDVGVLENVPDVCVNGLNLVVGALEEHGFDCRWQVRSASSLGAPHERNRFFLLAKRRGGTATANVKL